MCQEIRGNPHVGRKLAESLVEVVHLRQNANSRDDHENVSRGMCELVVSRKGQLQRNAKCLDSHYRDRADGRADAQIDEWVLLSVLRRNIVDHEDGKAGDHDRVDEEPCGSNHD